MMEGDLSDLLKDPTVVIEDWSSGGSEVAHKLSLTDVSRCADILALRIAESTGHSITTTYEDDTEHNAVHGVISISGDLSVDLIVAMVAVVRSGRPFLLLDPALPLERLRYQMDDVCCLTLLVCCQALPAPAGLTEGRACIPFDATALLESVSLAEDVDYAPGSVTSLRASSSAAELAYVCFTSGSTGRPKGVAVHHGALYSYARANARAHRIGDGSRVLLASAVSFDPIIGEAWTALGAPLSEARFGPGKNRRVTCTHSHTS